MPKPPNYKWDASIAIAAAIVSRPEFNDHRTTAEIPETYERAVKIAWDAANALDAEADLNP